MVDLSARSSCGGSKAQPAEPGAAGLGVCGLCPHCLPALFWKPEKRSHRSPPKTSAVNTTENFGLNQTEVFHLAAE